MVSSELGKIWPPESRTKGGDSITSQYQRVSEGGIEDSEATTPL